MLKALFSSETRVKILSLFITNPQNRYYLRGIIKLINAPMRAVQRELLRLEGIELLTKKVEGNRIYYQINISHLLFPDLKNIIFKTVGFGETLRASLVKENGIEAAFIYGSYAEGRESAQSDIDLFIIGDISGKKLQTLLRKNIKTYGRAMNPIIYSPAEYKKKKNGHFISSVLKRSKIMLKGNLNAV
jgi:predicted nucleotidyltransferase